MASDRVIDSDPETELQKRHLSISHNASARTYINWSTLCQCPSLFAIAREGIKALERREQAHN